MLSYLCPTMSPTQCVFVSKAGKMFVRVLLLAFALLGGALPSTALNNRPIIGVLSQWAPSYVIQGFEADYDAYIAASYVKFLELAGARVVPILVYMDDAYYETIASSVNGIFFPGGSTSITNSSGYGKAGRLLYDHVVRLNGEGVHLPLWGTCLGYEMITYLAAGDRNWLTRCSSQNMAEALVMEPGFESSKIFSGMTQELLTSIQTQEVTVNFHSWCMTKENFTLSGLTEEFDILSTNLDVNALEYLSTVEHKSLPIFGVQWHPEKNGFEWDNSSTHNEIPHTPEAIQVMQYMADFFVGQARLNDQAFAGIAAEEAALVYNYKPEYTGDTSSFEQSYLFPYGPMFGGVKNQEAEQ